MSGVDYGRRRLLRNTALISAGVPFVSLLQGCINFVRPGGVSAPIPGPYGKIRPTEDLSTGLPLLMLPPDFQYRSYSWTGDAMNDSTATPPRHDGMGVIGTRTTSGRAKLTLVRNHENRDGVLINAPARYDQVGSGKAPPGGGTVNLYFDPVTREWVGAEPSLAGTLINCAGGVTPWNTWLSCEETVADHTDTGGRKHGYVFEIPMDPAATTAQPLTGLGRFRHEAVAVDPATSAVYLTEDNRNLAALYRFVPEDTSQQFGSLGGGGRLQAARVRGAKNADLRTPAPNVEYELEWVDIPDPDAAPELSASGPFQQAWDRGALRMSRGEGIWYHDGSMYIVDTSAGRSASGTPGYGSGCLWQLDLTDMRLRAVFVSASPIAGNNPDNITVTPRSGVMLCEDGHGVDDGYGPGNRLLGLSPDSLPYIFAKNNVVLTSGQVRMAGKNVADGDYRRAEFCGACFDPSGEILFVNIQNPGITFAIWGPWEKGNL